LKADGERLPCIAKFQYNPKKKNLENSPSLSFTTRIQFCGVYPSSYYLLVHGTSAACLLTLQSYIFKHANCIVYSTNEDGHLQVKESIGKDISTGLFHQNGKLTTLKQSSFTPAGLSISTVEDRLKTELFWNQTSEVVLLWLKEHLDIDVRLSLKHSLKRPFQIK
jgi:hypothetical protein